MPIVSVLMPAYNTANYIAEAINSILNQTFSDFELIGFFPNGNDQQQNTVFQIAQSQDVYVLQYVVRN